MKCLKHVLLTKWFGVPKPSFISLGEWAVITGSTDGIGKAYAHELAKRGLNIVLISRSKQKLQTVANEIEQNSERNVKIIQADFSSTDIYQHIEENLRGLEIGILVNNVGIISKPFASRFLETNDLDKVIDNIIAVNMLSVVKMTQIVLPKMKERQKGLILNISSGVAFCPCPLLALYSSTKVFVERFSRCCQAEYGSEDIIIQCFLPFGVATKISKQEISLSIMSAENFVTNSLDCVLVGDSCCGSLVHEIQGFVYRAIPQWITSSKTLHDKIQYLSSLKMDQ
ncbi:17-beta-hydroxysteroid dehydrogenase type 3 [Narcine bancroftii]|uniref:17-beta-hydroxysteroid dehydrogenase type 3 n=1 Tax=Narcine bancroftii TaxID=1343680 RepID=UPI0038314A61